MSCCKDNVCFRSGPIDELKKLPLWTNLYLSTIALVDSLLLWTVLFFTPLNPLTVLSLLALTILVANYFRQGLMPPTTDCKICRIMFWRERETTLKLVAAAVIVFVVSIVFNMVFLAFLGVVALFTVPLLHARTKGCPVWAKAAAVAGKGREAGERVLAMAFPVRD